MKEGRIPKPLRYRDRPAFKLLVGSVCAYILYFAGKPLFLTFIGALLLFTFYLYIRKSPLWSELLLLSLYILLMGAYMHVSLRSRTAVETPTTLYDTALQVVEVQRSDIVVVKVADTSGKVLLRNAPNLRIGNELIADLDLIPLDPSSSNSYTRNLMSRGIFCTGNLQHIHTIGYSYSGLDLTVFLLRYRDHLIRQMDTALGDRLTPDQKGLIYALTLGERTHLSPDLSSHFTLAGAAHILAVSGFHLGIILLLLRFILFKVLPARLSRLRLSLLLTGLVLYTLFTGAAPSTSRALLMSGLFILAELLGRRQDTVQIWSLTILLLIWVEPFSPGSIGLILSASAVWGIFAWLPILDALRPVDHSLLKSLWQMVSLSIAAQIGVFPWLFYFFGTASLVFLWSAIPMTLLSTLLIPLALSAISPAYLLDTIPVLWVYPLRLLTQTMESWVDLVSDLPYAQWQMDLDAPAVVLYYVSVLTLYRLIFPSLQRHLLLRNAGIRPLREW